MMECKALRMEAPLKEEEGVFELEMFLVCS